MSVLDSCFTYVTTQQTQQLLLIGAYGAKEALQLWLGRPCTKVTWCRWMSLSMFLKDLFVGVIVHGRRPYVTDSLMHHVG